MRFVYFTKILLFYCCFYAGLAGFFSAMLAIFYTTLDSKVPKWQLDRSLIGVNPGLGFRPLPPESHVDSTLIWFKQTEGNSDLWTNKLDEFLKPYRDQLKNPNPQSMRCDYDTAPEHGKFCDVNISAWTPCTQAEKYSYTNGHPCIFLKLNKIYNWVPQYYNDTEKLPDKMPTELKEYIKTEKERSPNAKVLNTVWVSCEGENPADVENIGSIQYIPRRGFPGFYFPYTNVEGYLSPIIAIWFEKPATGVLINIECKAWAHNIAHDRAERRGSVHFELMVD